MACIPRRLVRLDSAADLSAYIDSADDVGAPVPDHYRALLSVVLRSPEHGKALERFRAPSQLLAAQAWRRNSARCLATVRATPGVFTDSCCFFAITGKERDTLLASAAARRIDRDNGVDGARPLPVADLAKYHALSPDLPLTLTDEEAPDKDGAPTLRLRRGSLSWVVRADLFGYLIRRYPGAAWHSENRYDPLSFVLDGTSVALLMPTTGE